MNLAAELAAMAARLAQLEAEVRGLAGQDEQHHPELLAKEIAAVRGKLAAVHEFQFELDARLRHMECLAAAFRGTNPN